MKNKEYSIKLFEVLFKNIKDLSDNEFDDLINGKGKLVYISADVEKETKGKLASKKYEVKDTTDKDVENGACELDKVNKNINVVEDKDDTYRDKILSMNSREEAYAYLRSKKFTKAILMDVAKNCKVSVFKSDKKDKIIEKIVEGVVGSKLKFKAIKECNLSSKKRM